MVDSRVGPTVQRPTHDISLTYGSTTVNLRLCDGKGKPDPRAWRKAPAPRTALQIRTGDPSYSSYELPYTPITQKDWSVGRGNGDFDKDGARYYDSYGLDTRMGDIILGPKATDTSVAYHSKIVKNGTAEHFTSSQMYASSIVFASTWTMQVITAKVKVLVPGTITFYIYSNSGGSPNISLASGDVYVATLGQEVDASANISYTFAPGTYWIVVQGVTLSVFTGALAGTTSKYWGGSWILSASDTTFAYTLENMPSGKLKFFEYKQTLYAITIDDVSSAPRMFYNGYKGMALSNTGQSSSLNTSLNLSGIDLTGKVAVIVSGRGSTELVSWRTILGNSQSGTNDQIAVKPPWNITQDTTTMFAILGCDNWTEVTGHGLTKPVSDVLVVDDIIYICQSSQAYIRRGRIKTDGTWDTWVDDGTNAADFLEMIPDTTGKRKIWRAQAVASLVSKSDVKAWGSNLSFSTAITCGNPHYRITNLLPYGTPQIPWIMKEDSFGSISNDVYAAVPLAEMASVRSERNGKAACQFGVYLFFSLLDGFERFYDNRLDDIGPNKDEGLPIGRQGPISKALPYPGGIIAAVDGGSDNTSAILFYNQMGWHELYRSTAGSRIQDMFVQVIPGGAVDRLWFCEEEDAKWLPICLNTRKQEDYLYNSTGYMVTAWYYGGFREISKYLDSLQIFSENLATDHRTLTVEYQTNSEADTDTWHAFPSTYTTSPMQDIDFSTAGDVSGNRWRLKITLTSDDTSKTPRVIAYTMNTVTRVKPKKGWALTFLADDATRAIQGEASAISADELISQLETWADSDNAPTPITLRSNFSEFDNLKIFIDPPNITPLKEVINGAQRDFGAIGTINVYEV